MSLKCGDCVLWCVESDHGNGYKTCGFFGRMSSGKCVCPCDMNVEKAEKALEKAKVELAERDAAIANKNKQES